MSRSDRLYVGLMAFICGLALAQVAIRWRHDGPLFALAPASAALVALYFMVRWMKEARKQ